MVDGSINHIAVVGYSIICSTVHISCIFTVPVTFNLYWSIYLFDSQDHLDLLAQKTNVLYPHKG